MSFPALVASARARARTASSYTWCTWHNRKYGDDRDCDKYLDGHYTENAHTAETFTVRTQRGQSSEAFKATVADLKKAGGRYDSATKTWKFPKASFDRVVKMGDRVDIGRAERGGDVRAVGRVDLGRGAPMDPAEKKAKLEAYLAKERAQNQQRNVGPSSKPSPKQVDYALSLIRRGGWRDSDLGQGSNEPTRADLERMSSKDVSAIIDDLRSGFR